MTCPEVVTISDNQCITKSPVKEGAINVMTLHRSFAFAIKFRVWSGRKGGRKAAMGGWSVGGFYAAKKWQVCPQTIRLQSRVVSSTLTLAFEQVSSEFERVQASFEFVFPNIPPVQGDSSALRPGLG